MNLPDILRRRDRSILLSSGEALPIAVSRAGRKLHAVRLAPGTRLRLRGASEFQCLRGFPRELHWTASAWPGLRGGLKELVKSLLVSRLGRRPGPELRLTLLEAAPSGRERTLFRAALGSGMRDVAVRLDWPSWAAEEPGYDLELSASGGSPSYLITGPVFDSRARILPLLRGNGVEIGPGLNPHVLPSGRVRVRYVESTPAEEWLKLYKKQDRPSVAATQNLWSRYIVDDGRTLAMIPDGTLDFVFSNHVLEHMPDPLGVLEVWARKLKPGGLLTGVVPDLRYTFDLRQPPSRPEEWLEERASAVSELPRSKYEKWCRYTAPYNTPEDLIARRYSIHAHYYTPETFREMAGVLARDGVVTLPMLHQSPNNKDFGFVMSRPKEV